MNARILALVVGLTLVSSVARAEKPKGVVLVHEGETGIWLGLTAHQGILADLKELRIRRTEVELLAQKAAIRDAQLTDLRLAEALASKAQETSAKALSAAVRGKREAEEARDAWHRSPMLWTGVGVVLTLATVFATAQIAK